jgi:hypothetical protein
VNILLVLLLIAGLLVGWFWLHRWMKGEGSWFQFSSQKKERRDTAAEMEAFIAAYRAGKINPAELKGEPPAEQSTPELASRVTARAAPAASPAAVLRPEVKLAYLTLRAGLPDHHVFPGFRLADLGLAAAEVKVDLLVCDAQFRPVAALDVATQAVAPAGNRAASFQAAGIRYIALAVARMPRPAQIRALIYPGQ